MKFSENSIYQRSYIIYIFFFQKAFLSNSLPWPYFHFFHKKESSFSPWLYFPTEIKEVQRKGWSWNSCFSMGLSVVHLRPLLNKIAIDPWLMLNHYSLPACPIQPSGTQSASWKSIAFLVYLKYFKICIKKTVYFCKYIWYFSHSSRVFFPTEELFFPFKILRQNCSTEEQS